MATGMVSTPFPVGLDSTGDALASESTTSAGCSFSPVQKPQSAASASESGISSDRTEILDEVRRAVMEDVDEKLTAKMKDLWARGNKMMKQVEQENKEQTAKLVEELAQRHEKQEALKKDQEHLRGLLTSMVQQFSLLSAAYGPSPLPFPAVPTPSTPVATEASSNCPAAEDTSSTLQESPPGLAAPGYTAGVFPPLPTMPDFPFPAAADTPSCATPLSLVSALGGDSLFMQTPTPTPDYGRVFSFTLRKADGADLGINVSHHESDKMLRIEGIRPEGAFEAWNRQCIGSAAADKAVVPGDRIISVNSVVNEPAKMLEECRDKQLLKFTILRGGPAMMHSPLDMSVPVAAPKTTTLRADASEFVPGNFVAEQVEANAAKDPSTAEAEATH